MTIANFKQQVANMMNRTLASLNSVNSQDMLLMAMNDARSLAQQAHNFELNRTENAYLATAASGALWTTGAKTTPAGATAILMKRIDEVWNYATDVTTGTGGATYYPRTTRIDYSYSGQFKRELPTVNNRQRTTATAIDMTIQNQFAYSIGPRLFITTISAMTPVKLVGIQWLDDLVDASDPDIFLTFFVPWFRYATIASLNVYLKDSERFPIDMTLLADMWASVKTMDGDIANMGEAMSLD